MGRDNYTQTIHEVRNRETQYDWGLRKYSKSIFYNSKYIGAMSIYGYSTKKDLSSIG